MKRLAIGAVWACAVTGVAHAEVRAIDAASTIVATSFGPAVMDHGGGFWNVEPQPCLSPQEHARIETELRAARATLAAAGKLPIFNAAPPTFSWPLRAATGLEDFGIHGISGFVDHEPAQASLRDWNCGTRTYDIPGYNHQGTDMFTWPFPFLKLRDNLVEIIAAAPGTIVLKSDGNFDQNCGFGGGTWNAVYVQHADGSIAWYGHMKNGSLTTKSVGQAVSRGEFLGIVGSSGNSTGPHLHLEIYNAVGQLLDPYLGTCNAIGTSWWAAQPPYYDAAINALHTHSAPPVFPPCPGIETPNTKDAFLPGQVLYAAAYYRDQRAGQVSQYELRRPDGGLFASWSHASTEPHYAASYWYWGFSLPPNAPTGYWKFRVRFESVDYEHQFTVGAVTDVQAAPAPGRVVLRGAEPNPFNPTTTITYELPAAMDVVLDIHDVQGRFVSRLDVGRRDAGVHRLIWRGADVHGHPLASGVYTCQLRTAQGTESRRIILLR